MHRIADETRGRGWQLTPGIEALCAVPFAILIAYVWAFHLDVPLLDQWEFVPFLDKSYNGTLTFGDFWAQHNEHRILAPRLVMLTLARLSYWNLAWEMAASIALALGLYALLLHPLSRIRFSAPSLSLSLASVLTSLLVFSLGQWENWLLGWQMILMLNIVASVGALFLLSNPGRGWGAFILALFLAETASLSFANGLICWPVGVGILWLTPSSTRRTFMVQNVLWTTAGILTILLYFTGYDAPGYHAGTEAPLQHPLQIALYVCAYLGAPAMGFNVHGAALAGAFALGALILCSWRAYRNGAAFSQLAPFLACAAYAIGSAGITAVGRSGIGPQQALSPRYLSFAILLWYGVFGLAALTGTGSKWRGKAALAIVLGILLLATSAHGAYRGTERYAYRLPARQALIQGDDLELLRRLHPDPEKVLERREIMRHWGLGVFHGKG